MIGSKKNEDRIMLFNWDISHTSKVFQFMISVGGVIFFYIIYGYLQELLFKIPGFKPFGWYLTFIQFACYTMLALVEQKLIERNKAQRRIPLKTYLLLAFLTVGTMGMSNASLGYLNYPTQVIFKCCKLIPVMLGGILIQGKRYGCSDFLSCLLMSVGLTFFILADSKVSPQFNYAGVLLISIALCADAAIGNVQEKYMKEFKPSNSEVVLYSYGIGIFYILLYLILDGSFVTGFQFFSQDVQSRYGGAVLFSLSGYLGITFVLTLIRCFGALATVTVTTFRKALTIMLSFFFFAKPFSFQYVWSGMIVLLGILLNIYQKNRETIKLKIIQLLHSKTRPAGSTLQQV